ncbi:Uncharacterized protein TCM_004408 [Theobroma cacao]|uniref:Uncharacterized protein n=1 Tax=Theobroma cacao TaxID=3641 RepID=A0A061DQW0_THECC|nr:Uncharacterized protein TCM_004408 [Theobroma cacao]
MHPGQYFNALLMVLGLVRLRPCLKRNADRLDKLIGQVLFKALYFHRCNHMGHELVSLPPNPSLGPKNGQA